jgi:hypothetical protein
VVIVGEEIGTDGRRAIRPWAEDYFVFGRAYNTPVIPGRSRAGNDGGSWTPRERPPVIARGP